MPRRHFLALSGFTSAFLTSMAWLAAPQAPLQAMPARALFRVQQGGSPLTAADFPVVLVCVFVSVPLRATLLRLAEEPRLYTGALFK